MSKNNPINKDFLENNETHQTEINPPDTKNNLDNPQENNKNKNNKEEVTWFSLVRTAILILIIVIGVRTFIGKPFIVQGSSMDPSFETWDYLLVDVFTYKFRHNPKRGDVLIFKAPEHISHGGKYFIKRVIGLPGESIEIREGKVIVYNSKYPEGFELKDDFVSEINKSHMNVRKMKLEEDEYYVMGDNRAGSYDSRFWGPLKEKYITGRAFLRLYPFNEINFLPAKVNFKN